ncbi:MAG: aspartate-semialdehyde dehydrogenase [Bacteroidales bacterium]|nr:aspartate-semialdehyde dehydrogenase [Bacteroidales bacterium]
MKVAVIGATGLVGTRMLEVLSQRNFPAREVLVAASEKSIGRKVLFKGQELTVQSVADVVAGRPDIALFSAGSSASREWAPRFAAAGCRVVDNSSCWRMDPTKKLVVPEINGDVLTAEDFIIANPNCSTIQMLLPLAPLHKAFGIKRIVVSTYQSVTGTGYKALSQLDAERKGLEWGAYPAVYPCPIDLNVIPQIGAFGEDGNSEEETKMINETHKILDPSIAVSVTTVRVPVRGGHSEAVNIELEKPFELARVREILSATSGVTLLPEGQYPVPKDCEGKDDVFVGRLRRDTSLPSALNLWCVSDNLRKGAATNAVQIAELLLRFCQK